MAGDLRGKGVALMMGEAALSLPEILNVRRVVKRRTRALFSRVLAVPFTLVGWGFNALT